MRDTKTILDSFFRKRKVAFQKNGRRRSPDQIHQGVIQLSSRMWSQLNLYSGAISWRNNMEILAVCVFFEGGDGLHPDGDEPNLGKP